MPQASLRVLVVDDDPVIRMLLGELLEDYSVSLFASAVDALADIAVHGTPHMIVSDVVMPVMDGPTFYARLSPEQQSRTVFMTGGCSWDTEAHLKTLGRPILCKPFSFSHLRNLISAESAHSE
ncbi:MAG: CheY-like chemotaxis protein [Myxococcota bacterium]|jgi:CheY-like chemotaxis protein